MQGRDLEDPVELRADIDSLQLKVSELEEQIKTLNKKLFFLIEENDLESPF